MEHIFRKEMLSCDFDHEDALYALFSLPSRTGADDEECLEFHVEITLSNLEVEYHDGKGWATDGCCKGYVVIGHEAMIEAIFGGNRYCLHDLLTKSEKVRLIEDAEESVIKECEENARHPDYIEDSLW